MSPPKTIVRSSVSVADVYTQALYLLEQQDYALADRFLSAVESAYSRLAEMPGIGVPRDYDRVELRGVRMWRVPQFPKYLIFYRVTDTAVEIIRVLHGAQDIPSILTGD